MESESEEINFDLLPVKKESASGGKDDSGIDFSRLPVKTEDTRPSLKDNYQIASKFNPDEIARYNSMVKRGVSPSAAFTAPDMAEKALSMPDFDVIRRSYPMTAQHLEMPVNMGMAHDDIKNLTHHEEVIQAHNDLYTLLRSFQAGEESSTFGLIRRWQAPSVVLSPEATKTQRFIFTATNLAYTYPTMIAAKIAAGLAAPFTGPAAPVVESAAMFAGPAAVNTALLSKFRNGQIDWSETAKQTGIEGIIGAFTGGVGLGAKAATSTAPLAVALAKTPLSEKAAAMVGKGIQATVPPTAELAAMTAGGAVAEGKAPDVVDVANNSILMLLMHGAGMIQAHLGRIANIKNEAAKTDITNAMTGKLVDAATASKYRTRDPEGHAKLVNNMTGDMVATIPLDKFNTLFQNDNPMQKAQELGVLSSYQEAAKTGGDVEIPMGTYVSAKMDAVRDQLKDDVGYRRGEDDITLSNNRLAEAHSNINESAKSVSEKADKMMQDDSDLATAHQLIKDDVISKISSLPDFKDPNVKMSAEQTADIFAKMMVVQAEHLNRDPLQVYEEKRLKMYGPGQQVNEMGLAQEDVKRLTGTKILDESGNPLRVFHATNAVFDKFNTRRNKATNKMGTYFTVSPEAASAMHGGLIKSIKAVYLNMKNPLDLTSVAREDIAATLGLSKDIQREMLTQGSAGPYSTLEYLDNKYDIVPKLKKKGYDGIIFDGQHEGITYVAFSPDQIVNAIGVKNPAELMQREGLPLFQRYGEEYFQPSMKKNLSHITWNSINNSNYPGAIDSDRFSIYQSRGGSTKGRWILSVRPNKWNPAKYSQFYSEDFSTLEDAKSRAEQLNNIFQLIITKRQIQFSRYKKTGSYYGNDDYGEVRVSDHPEGRKATELLGTTIGGFLYKLSDYTPDEINGIKFYRSDDWDVFIFPDGYALRNFRKIENKVKEKRNEIYGEEYSKSENGAEHFQSAWHGSPYNFDKFTLDHIGKGEGAQAYGWGLYFAGDKKVAEYYRDKLTENPAEYRYRGKNVEKLYDSLDTRGNDPEWASVLEAILNGDSLQDIKEHFTVKGGYSKKIEAKVAAIKPEDIKAYDEEGNEISKGHLYEANIPEDDVLLDWDKTLKEQNPKIQKKLIKLADEILGKGNKDDVTGHVLYKAIQASIPVLDSAKYASEILNSLGVKGIKYLDQQSRGAGEGSHNYVIFDDKAIDILNKYYQGKENEPLASYTKTQQGNIIKMFKNANASSFIHEIGHFILEDMKAVAESGKVSPEYVADWNKIQDYLGHKTGENLSVDQHEKFAKTFEAYLMEGKSPTPELKTAFQKIRDWMLQVYDGVKRKLGMEVTPEIRGVFDRLLAGKEAVDMAREELGPDLGLPELKGDALKARQMAEEMMLKPIMEQLREENKAKIEGERNAAMADAIIEVDKQPVYAAIKDLTDTAYEKGEKLTEQMVRNDADRYIQNKLSDERVELYDAIAELHGFSSGDELLKSIYSSDRRDTAINKMVSERMAKSTKMDSESLKEEAMKVLHSGDNLGGLMALEAQVLEGMRMNKGINAELSKARRELASQEWESAKAEASVTLGKKRWKESVKFRTYITLERKAAEQAAKATVKKDFEAALKAKREQLVSHAFAAESLRLKAAATKQVKFLTEQQKADKKTFKREEHFLQVASLLNRFGMGRTDFSEAQRGESLSQWVQSVGQHYGEVVSDIPAWLLNEAMSASYKDLTSNQLREVVNTIKHIKHIANQENSIFLGEKRAILDALAGELHSAQLASGNIGKLAKTSMADSWWDKVIKGKDWVRNEMISPETLLRKLDGYKNFGVWWKSLYEGYTESADARAKDMVETAEKLSNIWAKYEPKERERMDSRKIYVPELGTSLTKTEIMTIALNWGNSLNKERLLTGSGGYADSKGKWTEEAVQAVLDREMSKRDWDTVQEQWNLVNSFWPRIAELYKRITGFAPDKVQAEPVQTKYGTYAGGYFPLRRDTRLDVRGNEQMRGDEMLGDIPAWKASTKNGFTQARVSGAVYPVSLDIRGVSKHLTDVIHDLNLREWVLDSNRILGNKEVQVSMQDALGMEGLRTMRDWVRDVANTKGYESFDPILREIRRRTIISTLGLRLTSVILQFDDISAYGSVDPKNLGIGAVMSGIASHYSKVAARMETQKDAVDFVYSKSKYMKYERGENLDRDVSEAAKRSFGKEDNVGKAAMYFVTAVDHMLSIPVWKEAYKVGLKLNKGNEKLAVAYADNIIRRAQSSGRLGEMPKIMRGGEFQKALTMFYSFVSKRANLWYERIDSTRSIKDVPQLVGTAMALWVVPSLFSAAVHNGIPSTDEKKKKYMKELLMYPFSLFPVVRDVADFLMDKAIGLPSFGYGVTPLTRGVDVLGNAISAAKSKTKKTQDKVEAAAHAASVATPFPDQINSWVFNMADYANGKMKPQISDITKRRPAKERHR